MRQRVTSPEQEIAGLRLALEERGSDLGAARAANRELVAQLNSRAETRL
jgi:hypothetical protein